MKALILLAVTLFVLTACVTPEGVPYALVQDPTVEQARVQGAFGMCIKLTADDKTAYAPLSFLSLAQILSTCINETISLFGNPSAP